jgi:hypothetical protein
MASAARNRTTLVDRGSDRVPRARERLKNLGRRVTYRIAGLPIAIGALRDRRGSAPDTIIRQAYARRYWHVRNGPELVELLLGVAAWPMALIGLAAVFTRKNGAAATQASRRSIVRQVSDQLRLYFTAGVLPPWYYVFEFHQRPFTSHARNFIYRWESKGGVVAILNERVGGQTPIMKDKAAFADRCLEHQVPTVPTFAIVNDGRVELKVDPVELDADLFVKPVFGRGGKGAERWDLVGPGLYCSSRGLECDRDGLFAHLAAVDSPLLIQPRVANHPALNSLNNGALSTIRVLTCLDERGAPELIGAALRMAIGGNRVVDNLHAGGIAAAIDLESGMLGSASNLGADSAVGWLDRHPDTGALISGTELPYWDDVRDVALRSHRAFPERLLVGWDIAITTRGPLMIEGNGAPDLDIMQRFARRGLMASRLGVLLAFHLSQPAADQLPLAA